MLGFLLARAGVNVVVLEKHADFLRDFRGDTVHPSTLELLDELGLDPGDGDNARALRLREGHRQRSRESGGSDRGRRRRRAAPRQSHQKPDRADDDQHPHHHRGNRQQTHTRSHQRLPFGRHCA
jgi:2-polyprenyl-6-methoxyphenol hydroxylase-like FAD-dependent oxidoreductase